MLLFIGSVLLVLALTGLLAGYQVYTADHIVPGVSAGGVALGGLTAQDAYGRLNARFLPAADAVFTFQEPETGRFWQYRAADLGVAFDAAQTVQAAFAVGRKPNIISSFTDQALVWLNGRDLTPTLSYNQAAAVTALEAIATEINRVPADAVLTFDGSNVTASPGAIGRSLDIRATLDQLDAAILAQQGGGEIALVVSETPPAAFDVDAAALRARVAISAPVTLYAESSDGGTMGPWMASVDQIKQLLRVEPVNEVDGSRRYEVTINLEAYRPYLQSLAQGMIVIGQDGRFHYDAVSNQLVPFQPAVNGRTLDVDATLARFEEAVFRESNRLVPMAFQYQPPRYPDAITAAELGIREQIAQGTSSYAGSTRARIDNILVAASRFDGLIVAPGEEFSFNRYVGDISPEAGFVSGKIIFGGRTIDGVGGGVCQVSTTAFRAAFYAGFPIFERHAHGYRVGYYERGDSEGVGMDAAIYTPDLDLRFLNDSPAHILIEVSVYPATSTIQFRFYGTNDGRQVVKQGPTIRDVTSALPTRYEANPELGSGQQLQVDWPAEGAYVEVQRLIYNANGDEIGREIFASQYQPWGAVVQVSAVDLPPGT